MTWLVRLYPPAWRRRYGAELVELIAAQPFSIATAVDLMAGAVDAWRHPQVTRSVAATKGDQSMMTRMLQLKCADYGPNVTQADARKNFAINIAGTFVLATVWVALIWVWKREQLSGKAYLNALLPMTYVVPYLVGLRYTSLKDRSVRAQTTVIAGLSVALTVFLLFVGWITTRI